MQSIDTTNRDKLLDLVRDMTNRDQLCWKCINPEDPCVGSRANYYYYASYKGKLVEFGYWIRERQAYLVFFSTPERVIPSECSVIIREAEFHPLYQAIQNNAARNKMAHQKNEADEDAALKMITFLSD